MDYVNPFRRVPATWDAGLAWARKRSTGFDHLWRARERFNAHFGPRLAAAIAYYGFFAAFALALLAYSILGYLLSANDAVLTTVNRFLERNLPFLSPQDIQNARQTVAVISIIGLVLAGVGWVDGMRSSQRAMWELDQQPGNLLVRRVIDLAMLVLLGLLLSLSLWLTMGIQGAVRDILSWVSPDRIGGGSKAAVQRGDMLMGQLGALAVNLVLAAGLLVAVPRLRVSPRRVLPSVILVGLGLSLLSTVGQLYITRTEHNPVGRIAGAAVGLLIFLDLFSQVLLYGAALAATSDRGRVTDLAAGPPPARPGRPARPGSGSGSAAS